MHSYLKTVFTALLLAFIAAGCGNQKNSAYLPPADIRDTDIPAPATSTAGASYSTPQIHVPRPQAEIDALFSTGGLAANTSGNPAYPRTAFSEAVPPYGVIAHPEWGVNITREWYHIVIHHSASPTGSAASFNEAHIKRGWDGLGYHFVIGNGSGSGDGEVEVGYRWKQQLAGAHAGNAEYNQHGIGICLVGDFENGSQPTARQMTSLRQLVCFLQVKTGIPTSEVIGHCNVPPRHTVCPGDLDLVAFRASLGGGAIGVPIHYVQPAKPASHGTLQVARTTSSMALP